MLRYYHSQSGVNTGQLSELSTFLPTSFRTLNNFYRKKILDLLGHLLFAILLSAKCIHLHNYSANICQSYWVWTFGRNSFCALCDRNSQAMEWDPQFLDALCGT